MSVRVIDCPATGDVEIVAYAFRRRSSLAVIDVQDLPRLAALLLLECGKRDLDFPSAMADVMRAAAAEKGLEWRDGEIEGAIAQALELGDQLPPPRPRRHLRIVDGQGKPR